MEIKATEDQIRQLAVNAIKASSPMGNGILVAALGQITGDGFDPKPEDVFIGPMGIDLDYVKGRMVKLHIRRRGDNQWSLPDFEPRLDYQSWSYVYESYHALVASVDGITVA